MSEDDEKPICEACFGDMMEQMTGNGVGYENGYYQCRPLSQHEIENCSINNINFCEHHYDKIVKESKEENERDRGHINKK